MQTGHNSRFEFVINEENFQVTVEKQTGRCSHISWNRQLFGRDGFITSIEEKRGERNGA